MRLAVLSDVHGNLVSLEAVLSDLEKRGAPDSTWILGDLVAFGAWPSQTLARLREIPDVSFLQGNTDRYVVSGRRPAMIAHSPEEWSRIPDRLAVRDATFRWTVRNLSFDDCKFLRDLPTQLVMEVPGFGGVLAVHASLDDDETNILPSAPDDELSRILASLRARVMLYGHTHRPMDRSVAGRRVVNPGSVGLPLDGDPRASYTTMDIEGGKCTVTTRRVQYGREAVLKELDRLDHPGRTWVAQILRSAASPA
jgi:predicted phosphodiesterase